MLLSGFETVLVVVLLKLHGSMQLKNHTESMVVKIKNELYAYVV